MKDKYFEVVEEVSIVYLKKTSFYKGGCLVGLASARPVRLFGLIKE